MICQIHAESSGGFYQGKKGNQRQVTSTKNLGQTLDGIITKLIDLWERQKLGATQLKGVKEKKTRGDLLANKDNILGYLLYHTTMVVPTHEKPIRRPAM